MDGQDGQDLKGYEMLRCLFGGGWEVWDVGLLYKEAIASHAYGI